MFVCKLRTPSCSHYEHFHVYLAHRRQTGNVVPAKHSTERLHTFQGVSDVGIHVSSTPVGNVRGNVDPHGACRRFVDTP